MRDLGWREHQRLEREDRANGLGSDPRERDWHYGRDVGDEVYEPPARPRVELKGAA